MGKLSRSKKTGAACVIIRSCPTLTADVLSDWQKGRNKSEQRRRKKAKEVFAQGREQNMFKLSNRI